jgi:hypothetical protein
MRRQSQQHPALHRKSRGRRRRSTFGAGFLTAFLAMLLWAVPGAMATETIFWSNYTPEPDTIAFANIDGAGGGQFNASGASVENSEGMAIDSATGRLFWANSTGGVENKGGIFFANLDGSGGGGQLNTAGAEVNTPLGVAIDPITRRIFWANIGAGGVDKGSIAFASLEGGAGGRLDTTGATVDEPGPVAIDVVNGRLYWGNYGNQTISYASLGGGSGGQLSVAGATAPNSITGLAVDPAGGRIYWLNNISGGSKVSYAALSGSGGADVPTGAATLANPYGMAFDPTMGRIYWGNYGNGETRTGAISYAAIGGGAGDLTIATAPVAGPQDPVILKSPGAAGAPLIARSPASREILTCSQGTWAADFPGSSVYQAPRSYAYQWSRNGAAIVGATATSYKATQPGSYACSVIAANAGGSTTQTSALLPVKAAKLALAARSHKAQTKAGHAGTFAIKVTNTGDLKSSHGRLCVKLAKGDRKDLKAPKCRALGSLAGHKKRTVKVRVKAGSSAEGSYKLAFTVRGAAAGKNAKAKLIVKP